MAKVFHIVSDTEGERLIIEHPVNKGEDRGHTTETHTDPTSFSAPLFTFSNEACQIVEVQILTEEIVKTEEMGESYIQSDSSSMPAGYVVEEGALDATVNTEDFGEDYGGALTNDAESPTHHPSLPSSCPNSPSPSFSPISSPSSPAGVITAELLQDEDGLSNMAPVLSFDVIESPPYLVSPVLSSEMIECPPDLRSPVLSSDMMECPPDLVSRFQLKRLSVRLVDCLATLGQKGTTNTNKNGEKQQTGILGRRRYGHGPTGERPYHCLVCERRFTRAWDLKRHQRLHTGDGNYFCHPCNRRFKSASQLSEHQLTHTGEKTYRCPQCGLRFARLRGVRIHQSQKHKESRGSRLPAAGNISPVETLREHQSSYTEKPFQCTQCEECFSEMGALTRHQRIHSDWQYDCLQCGQRFSSAGGLAVHQCSLAEVVFQEQSFPGAETLGQHQIVHADDKPYACPLCGLRFARYRGMRIHQSQAHKWSRLSSFSMAGDIRPAEACKTVNSRNRTIVLPRRYTS